MSKIKIKVKSELKLRNIKGFLEKVVTKFGTGAKVTCPKEYLGKKAILIILEDEKHKDKRVRGKQKT